MKRCGLLVVVIVGVTFGCRTYPRISPESVRFIRSWNERKWFGLDSATRVHIAHELGETRVKGAITLLGRILLCDREQRIASGAMSSLMNLMEEEDLKEEVFPVLERNIAQGSPYVVWISVHLLARLGTNDAAQLLVRVLKGTQDERIRIACLMSVANSRGTVDWDLVRPFLTNNLYRTRDTTVFALTERGRTNDYASVMVRTQDVNPMVQDNARFRLVHTYSKATSIPILLELVRDPGEQRADEFCLTSKRDAAIAELKRLSGKDYGKDLRAWEKWWEEEKRKPMDVGK